MMMMMMMMVMMMNGRTPVGATAMSSFATAPVFNIYHSANSTSSSSSRRDHDISDLHTYK